MSISKETKDYLILKSNTFFHRNYNYNNEQSLKDYENILDMYCNYYNSEETYNKLLKIFNDGMAFDIQYWTDHKNKILEKNFKYEKMLDEINSIQFPEEYNDFIDYIKSNIEKSIQDISWTNSEIERLNNLTFEDWIQERIVSYKASISNIQDEMKLLLQNEAKKANLKVFLNDQTI